jgi:16S rRNA (uracil1498-N3)-methyltransferase
VKLDTERAASRQTRLAAIAREAAKQARRAAVPAVEVARLDDALALPADLRLVCMPAARPLREVWTRTGAASIVVGPEGGLSPAEVDRAIAAGFEPIGLGPNVLRAETAGVVAASALRIATY